MPGTLVAPSLFIAGTDSKHYTAVAKGRIYRQAPLSSPLLSCFLLSSPPDCTLSARYYPFKWDNADLSLIHNTDERVRISDVVGAVNFFSYYLLAVSMHPSRLPPPVRFANPSPASTK